MQLARIRRRGMVANDSSSYAGGMRNAHAQRFYVRWSSNSFMTSRARPVIVTLYFYCVVKKKTKLAAVGANTSISGAGWLKLKMK